MVRFCPSGDVKMVRFCSSGDVKMVRFNSSGDVKMVRFRPSGDVKMVWFCPSGDVKMVWFCSSGDVGIVWWNPSGDVKDGLILGSLGRRWFGLVFALGRRKIHLTSPESGQRLPSQTIRLPREKITRETSKTGSGYIWIT